MKLVTHCIIVTELQEWLDKYQDKVKFIIPITYMSPANMILIVVDEN